VELSTTNASDAKQFYSGLFGWEAKDEPAGPMTYTTLRRDGKDVAGLYQLGPDQAGMPPNWGSYVSVASADETARKVSSLGGKVAMEPFDVMEHGRMAVFQDPLGAFVSVWQPNKHHGFDGYGTPGFVCWNELMTTDTKKARDFYTRLFDWKAEEQDFGAMRYTMFKLDDKPVGGMLKITDDMGPVPPNWMVYFAVEDCDASVNEAKRLGGRITVPPSDIPKVGRFSVLTDPQGAAFAVIRLTM
jgi:hypothetical protein